jgi:hypothetical protein
MAQTITQFNPAVRGNLSTGRILDTGTVAAMAIVLGYKPRYVKVINNTSGDQMEWIQGMADASAFKKVAAGTTSLITSNGITPTANGFTLGLDTDVLVTSEQITWVAMA